MTHHPKRGPVFIVGAPRSGTTLVYSLLLSSGDFVVYEEGETRLLQCRSRYGPLRFDFCYRRFMKDWVESDQFRRSGLPSEEFRRGADDHRSDYVAFLNFFMSEMCRAQSKERWAEKTPGNVYHLDRLARAFPTGRFVHVIRDARDVALSRRRLGWHVVSTDDPERQLLGAARHWEQLVRIGRSAGTRLGDRYLEVRYEDLVTEPDNWIARLSEFTGADVPIRVDAANSVGALKGGFSAFDSQVEGISSAPVERWRDQLTSRECRIVTAAVGKTLRGLGYPADEGDMDPLLRWSVTWLGAVFGGSLALRRWLREHTYLRTLKKPRLLDFGGHPVPHR